MDTTNLHILHEKDISAFFAHLERMVRNSDRDGAPPFTPLGKATQFDDTIKATVRKEWQKNEKNLSWSRVWGAWDNGEIIGHVKIRGAHEESRRHRVMTSIGIDRSTSRNQGLGTKLMQTAISFVQASELIEWIDLTVFDDNKPAIGLYKKFGFIETGHREDDYRIEGQSKGQLYMSLRLKTPPAIS